MPNLRWNVCILRKRKWLVAICFLFFSHIACNSVFSQRIEQSTNKPKVVVDFGPLPKATNGLPDYYTVFGLAQGNFTVPLLKRAYRRLSLIYHPDRQKKEFENQAKKKFIDITTGYTILLNADKRATYDVSLKQSDVKYDSGTESDSSDGINTWLDEVFFKEAQASAEALIKDAFLRVDDIFRQFSEFSDDGDFEVDDNSLASSHRKDGEDYDDDNDNDIDDDDNDHVGEEGKRPRRRSKRRRRNKSRHDRADNKKKHSGDNEEDELGLKNFLKGFFEDELNEIKDYFKAFVYSPHKEGATKSHRDEL